MALSDKNLVITPNIGSANDPKIVFSGADASTAAQNITLTAYPTNGGTLSFDGSTGQLFSVTNSMSGTIFSANDVSGIPSIEVIDTGLVKVAQYSGNVLLGTGTDTGLAKLQVTGSLSLTGNILHSPTGRSIYGPNPTWSSYLYVGGDGTNGITRTGSIASIVTTNGNMHIDSGSDKGTYLNLYSGAGGIYFGNGAGGANATMSAGGVLAATAVTITNGGTGSNGPLAVSGDATVYRNATGGVLYFGSNRNNYIQYDGSNYYLGGSGGLYINGNTALHSGNYTSYSPTLTGGSASGTWGISITGNAASASALSTSGTISSYMSDVGVLFQSYNASAGNAAQFNITHSYGAVTISNVRGALTLNGTATNATTAANLSTSSPIYRTAAGAGYLNGQYPTYENTTTTGAIYSIGGAYVPGTTSLGNMYGVGYTYSQAVGNPGGAPNSVWGLYGASSGTAKWFLDSDGGSGYFNGSLYAGGIKVPTISIQDTAPTGTTGSFWWQSSTGKLKIYYNDGTSSQWVDAVPIPDTSTFYSKAGGAITGPIVGNSSLSIAGTSTMTGKLRINGDLWGPAGDYAALVIRGTYPSMIYRSTTDNKVWLLHHDGNFNWYGANDGNADSTAWTKRMHLQQDGVLYINNNIALHAGNYTSYSPSLTGGSASGTWGISVTGSSASCTGNAATATGASGNFYINTNYGRGIVGLYDASRYQGVFAMGDSYKLADDGTTTGSLYGLAWSHPNAGGAAGNLTDHGLLVLINGVFKCAISNSIVASANITAYSDERLKTNWRDMPENFVARLAQIKVGIYDRIDEEDVTQVGVSAQSLQELLPQAIMTAKDDMQTLSVNYGGASLASAVELAKEVVSLNARIARLEALVSKLIEG